MKKLAWIFTLLAAAVLPAKAQKGDTLTIGQTAYRVTYDSKTTNDTTVTPYHYLTDEMRLDISGDGVSKFYSHSWVLALAYIQKNLEAGNGYVAGGPKAGLLRWTYYKNYPAKGKTLMLENVNSLHKVECEIEEVAETPEWTLVADSTAEILGYQCQMAVTRFHGRTWYAWYTEDIPIDEGPWKLRGLPGLVLRAYDSSRQFVFDGTGLEQVEEPITFVKRKREKVSYKDFRRMQENVDLNAELKAMSGGHDVKIAIQNSDGSTSETDRLPKPKFNFIELE